MASLAIATDGTPYVASAVWGAGIEVMKYSGGAWSMVGNAYPARPWMTNWLSLAIAPDGTPFVASNDDSGFLAWSNDGYGGYAYGTVIKYVGVSETSPTGWATVGIPGFTASTAATISMVIASDGTPYMAYSGSDRQVHVMGYVGVSETYPTGWAAVGSPGVSCDFYAGGLSLKIAPDGTFFVAFSDISNRMATVIKYLHGSWITVGSPGFSFSNAGIGNSFSFAFAPDGTPFLAYATELNGVVVHFSEGVWSQVGDSIAGSHPSSLVFGLDGIPYMTSIDNGDKVSVLKLLTAAPMVTGISPSIGSTSGGTTVTISGSGFLGASAVKFGNISATNFTVNSDTQITVTAPALTASKVDIGVTTPVSSSPANAADLFTILDPASILPGAPTSVTATADRGQARVSFLIPVPNGGTPITLYTVNATPGNITVTTPVSPVTVTGLANGTAYTFSVTATNGAGKGPTVTAANMDRLDLTLDGTGNGSVNSSPPGIHCTEGTCGYNFAPVLPVNQVVLTPTAASGSRFSGWNGVCEGTGPCSVVMNPLYQGVTANFDVLQNAKIVGNPRYYGLLQAAYDDVPNGGIVQAKAVAFAEEVTIDKSKSIVLKGGFDSDFSAQSSSSVLQGSLKISQGCLFVDHFAIK